MSSRDVAERLRSRRLRGEVQTPEGTLHVRGLSGAERVVYYDWIRSSVDSGASVVLGDQRLVATALCDESGAALFESFEDALAVVADWNSDDVTSAAKEVLRLSGLARGAIEAAEKKS